MQHRPMGMLPPGEFFCESIFINHKYNIPIKNFDKKGGFIKTTILK
jgi:hypothetical protein